MTRHDKPTPFESCAMCAFCGAGVMLVIVALVLGIYA